jgi:hypothetical protein
MNDKENRFDFPDLLWLASTNSLNSDDIKDLIEHFYDLLEWIEEDKDEKSTILKVVFKLLIDKIEIIQSRINEVYESIPSMPQDQWNILQNKFDEFIKTMGDLKLNKNRH